jgi:hypothetical protein
MGRRRAPASRFPCRRCGQTGDVADTLYADVSEWQVGVNDSYPHPVLCIRSNDGTHRDRRWVNNYGWCLRNAESGRLTFFIVYFVWRPNWQQTVDTFKDLAGTPHPKMAVMLDVESWSGQIRGDRSAGINAAYDAVGAFVGVDGEGDRVRQCGRPEQSLAEQTARHPVGGGPTSTPTVRATAAACPRVRHRSAAAT